MKKIRILLLCMALCLTACTVRIPEAAVEPTAVPEEATAVPEEATAAPEEPGEAPETGAFNTEMMFSGTTFDCEPIDQTVFADYDLIIVNVWAEWCGPCVGEMPELERIHQDYPNVLILGVLSFSNDPDAARETVRETGVTYPVLEPAGSLTALVDQFDAIPATMFFDGEGNQIAEPVIGSRDYTEWKTINDELLGSETEPFPTEVNLEDYIDESYGRMISITAVVPAHATLRIAFPNQEDYTYRNDEDRAIMRKVKMPVEVFYSNMPLDEAEQIFTPRVTIETEDGQSVLMDCASFTTTFPELHLELSGYVPEKDGVYHVPVNGDGVFPLTGRVEDPTAEVSVNGLTLAIYEGGIFLADLALENGQATTYEIRAEKGNCVSAVITVVLEP
jgi:thiol-disulfide isomerase/thioredoxin